ncbi:MAG: YigZ family protein [Bacteroidota bacterium]|nr:YigZ family protein [Bacteroidota bacterium]
MNDEYFSIAKPAAATLKVEGSKFIAAAIPIGQQEDAERELQSIRKKYFDATHHCFAYALGIDRAQFRYSDDGEPAGTAGVKIFSAIQSKNVSDLLVVVTRYFGGTKLGVGGLGRAYYEAARTALDAAEMQAKLLAQQVKVTFPYAETSGVMNSLSSLHAKILDTLYDDDVTLTVAIRKSSAEAMVKQLTDATRGNVAIQRGTHLTMPA